MQEIMDTWKPHTAYHAAVDKHVPLAEHNPAEGVRNNVWGTRVCVEAVEDVHPYVRAYAQWLLDRDLLE